MAIFIYGTRLRPCIIYWGGNWQAGFYANCTFESPWEGDDVLLSKESALFWLLGSSRPLLQVGCGEDLAKVHMYSSLKYCYRIGFIQNVNTTYKSFSVMQTLYTPLKCSLASNYRQVILASERYNIKAWCGNYNVVWCRVVIIAFASYTLTQIYRRATLARDHDCVLLCCCQN